MPTRPDAARGSVPRLIVGVLLATAAAIAAVSLARVDADLGAATGPDRLLRAIDADPALTTADVESARAILRSRPIDGSAYRVLAQNAAGQGDATAAMRLYAIAVDRAPRDRPTRAVLADDAFARNAFDTAALHLDALLRVAPSLAVPVATRLVPQLKVPGLREAMHKRLLASPPWRHPFIAALRDPKVDAGTAEALLAGLSDAAPLSPAETSVHVDLLERLGRHADARAAWLASVTPDGEGGAVHDGGFEGAPTEGGYGWRIPEIPGVAIGLDDIDSAQGAKALSLEFEGRAMQLKGPTQWLVLAPGHYQLSFQADNRTEAARPFYWRVTCRGSGRELALIEVPARTDGWAGLQAHFQVPVGCPAQALVLNHAARSLVERQVRGTLRFDAVRIARLRRAVQ